MASHLHLRLASFLLLLFVFRSVNAQQANIWYFGYGAGIDFNGGIPVPIGASQMSTNEGCASICDNNGNLVFYTDGVYIWNAQHTLANPSNPMLGNNSATQAAVIVPRPGSPNRYFIFTQDEWGLGSCTGGMNWSEVQVNGNNITIQSINNQLLPCSLTTEKIAIACHPNGTDYWAVTVRSDGDFVTYPITAAGVGAPVTSLVSASPGLNSSYTFPNDDKVGYMKISLQGHLLVLGRRHSMSVNQLFTFDNITGQVTSVVGTYHTGTVYGVEFAPDGNSFYASIAFQFVRRYDVNTLAMTQIGSGGGHNVGALQLGPDGNIYVANGYEGIGAPVIDRILDPNNVTPVYQNDYITLVPGTSCRLGLPGLVSCFLEPVDPVCLVNAGFISQPGSVDCSYIFTDTSTADTASPIIGWQWDFGDNQSSSLQNPTHQYVQPGNYTVCLIVTATNGADTCHDTTCTMIVVDCDTSDPVDPVLPCNVDAGFTFQADTSGCRFLFTGIAAPDSTSSVISWYWTFGDGVTSAGPSPQHEYPQPGSYIVCLVVTASNGNTYCKDTVCATVMVADSCLETDEKRSCTLYLPNTFTPNNDGKNEVFGPKYECDIREYEFRIFNRWGEQVFYSAHPDFGWDGQVNATTRAPQAVYVYRLRYTSVDEEDGGKEMWGKVNLIR